MRGPWELVSTRSGGSVTSLVTSGNDVIAATPAGLRLSSDCARTWSARGPALSPPVELAVPAPAWARTGLILAGTGNGLYRSTEYGATWTATLVGSRVLAIVFATDELVLVGTEQDGILRSEDGGCTFKSGNPGLLDLTVVGLARSPNFDADQTAYAATPSGLFHTRNAGRAWRAMDSLPGEPALQCVAAIGSMLLVGTEADGLFLSVDRAASWTVPSALASRSITALAAAADGRLAAGTESGVAVSYDHGETWHASDLGPVLSVAFAPDGSLLAGVPRRGVLRCADDQQWKPADVGLRANLAVALAGASDDRLYLAGLEDGISVSIDAGITWLPAGPPDQPAAFDLSANADYAATAAGVMRRTSNTWECVEPSAVRAVRCVGSAVAALRLDGHICISADSGATWSTLALPAEAGAPNCLDLVENETLLAGASTGVWRNTPTAGWHRILAAEGVSSLLAAPTYAIDQRVFAGLDDEIRMPLRGITEVVRGERRPQWQRTSLPSRVTTLAVSPTYARDRTVIAGTAVGVCISNDAGASFSPWSNGTGETPIVALAFSPTYAMDHLVYAVELGGRIRRARNS